MSHFPKYDSYKDSEVEWLGEVPKHWEALRAKHVFRNVSEKGYPDEPLLSATQDRGVVPRDQLEQRVVMPVGQLQTFKLVRENDFVISLRSFQGGIEHCAHRGLVSPAYTVLRLHRDVNPLYLRHLLKASSFISELNISVTGIRQGKNIDYGDFAESFLPLPPKEEQDRIVAFLDAKTAPIDELIAKKQRQVELLEEQKAIRINQAVTRGLNPKVNLKPSGIEWIGDIPEHWEVKKIKYLSQIFRGKFTHRPRNDPSLYDGEYPFIQTGDVAKAGIHIHDYSQTLNEKGLRVSTLVPKGTIAITIAANIGDVAVLGFDACFPDSVVGFLPKPTVERFYFFYVLKGMKTHFLSLAPKNTQHNLNVERVGGEFIAVPPPVEQTKIISLIEQLDEQTRGMIEVVSREIKSLKTLRSTLIAHAVTGRIKV